MNIDLSNTQYRVLVDKYFLSKKKLVFSKVQINSFKMKIFVVILATLTCYCLAAPLDDSKNAQIVKYENDAVGLGGYSYA